MAWHLLHPAIVHFPIALLSLGFLGAAGAASRKGPVWLSEASSWLLWIGVATVWLSFGLGLLAEKFAPHVPAAWEAFERHEESAYWTAGLFTAVALGRLRLRGNASPPAERALLAAWAVALASLLRTAYLGGELVFRFGMGVIP